MRSRSDLSKKKNDEKREKKEKEKGKEKGKENEKGKEKERLKEKERKPREEEEQGRRYDCKIEERDKEMESCKPPIGTPLSFAFSSACVF